MLELNISVLGRYFVFYQDIPIVEHPETLKVVRRLIEKDKMPRSVKAPNEILGGTRTSLKAAENFIEMVAAGQIKRTDKEAADKKV